LQVGGHGEYGFQLSVGSYQLLVISYRFFIVIRLKVLPGGEDMLASREVYLCRSLPVGGAVQHFIMVSAGGWINRRLDGQGGDFSQRRNPDNA